jgi:hypothetical protein
MKCTIFWNIAPCSPEGGWQKLCFTHTPCCLLDLLFDSQDGGTTFIRNVGRFLPHHTALNRACTALGYIPISLQAVTVVFIPEQCRTLSKPLLFYSENILKVGGQIYPIRGEAVMRCPLYLQWDEYQTSRFVETSIHSLVYKMGTVLRTALLLWELTWAVGMRLTIPRSSPITR